MELVISFGFVFMSMHLQEIYLDHHCELLQLQKVEFISFNFTCPLCRRQPNTASNKDVYEADEPTCALVFVDKAVLQVIFSEQLVDLLE